VVRGGGAKNMVGWSRVFETIAPVVRLSGQEQQQELERMRIPIMVAALLASTPALAQSSAITFYELPFFAGRSVTVTAATPDLATVGFARRAQSARVSGSWQVCPETKYAGTCQTLTGDQRALAIFGLGGVISSVRTTADATKASEDAAKATTPATTTPTPTTPAAGAAATGPTKVDLSALDAGRGTVGQDVAFFAVPKLGGSEVSTGTTDKAAGDAFCKAAGYTSSLHASRARVQASNLIDMAAATKGVRSYPLRDVLCTR
jgi:hypothetical protein